MTLWIRKFKECVENVERKHCGSFIYLGAMKLIPRRLGLALQIRNRRTDTMMKRKKFEMECEKRYHLRKKSFACSVSHSEDEERRVIFPIEHIS